MRILWLTPYLPLPIFGGGVRVFNLMKTLAVGSDIDLIATSDLRDGSPAELAPFCRTVEIVPPTVSSRRHKRLLQIRSVASRRPSQYWMLHSPEMQDRIFRAMSERDYDVVILEHSFMGYYDLADGPLTVLDQHNVESDILFRASRHERSALRRGYNLLEYWRYRADEERTCRAADLILTTSDRDLDAMQHWKAMPECVVIPNGVDTSYFTVPKSKAIAEQQGSVLFTGSMHYIPNADAMLHFATEIWPRILELVPYATLKIVGGVPPPEILQLGRLPNVTVLGFVPDVRPYLAGAQVVVAPLRIGGGTRLKILEAMAMGRAIVSTSVGCEGLSVRHGRHLQVADEPAEFADCVAELLRAPAKRAELGQEGRRLVEDSYDWHSVGMQMESALCELVGRVKHQRGHRDLDSMVPGTTSPLQ